MCGFAPPHFAVAGLCYGKPFHATAKRQLPVTIDDCTHYRVLQIYKKRTTGNALNFLDRMAEQLPFPVQRIQADRGMEFFTEKVQLRLVEHGTKFRPNKSGSPHLNGKVERSQKTDLEGFCPPVFLKPRRRPDAQAQTSSPAAG